MSNDIKVRAQALADETADAYSWDNYGDSRWLACITMLLRRGYSDDEAVAIMRSKWTRWAADCASDRKGWRYGHTTSADLARFIDGMPEQRRRVDLADLVAGTPRGEYV